jgi:hypothetical protein
MFIPFQIADLECKLRQPQQSESEVALLKQTVIYK